MDKKLVMKFGGTSLMTIERIKNAAQIVAKARSAGTEIVVVVSAMGHTTDQLIQMYDSVRSTDDRRELDALMATGEQQAASLMTMALQSLGCRARSFNGAQAGIATDMSFGNARIEALDSGAIFSALKSGTIPVVTGFQGATITGEIATLGRGGSDITAIALAYALGACRCDIYTDVDGLYSADPRLISEARRLESAGVDEVLKLAQNGAQVLNARSVEWAKDKNVAVRVRSTFCPDDEGTLITARCDRAREFTGVTINHNLACMELELNKLELGPDRDLRRFRQNRLETKKQLLKNFIDGGVSAEIVYALKPNPFKILFAVPKDQVARAEAILRHTNLSIRHIKVDTEIASVVMVATEITDKQEIACLDLVKANDIALSGFSCGKQALSLLVPRAKAHELAHLIHHRFAGMTIAA